MKGTDKHRTGMHRAGIAVTALFVVAGGCAVQNRVTDTDTVRPGATSPASAGTSPIIEVSPSPALTVPPPSEAPSAWVQPVESRARETTAAPVPSATKPKTVPATVATSPKAAPATPRTTTTRKATTPAPVADPKPVTTRPPTVAPKTSQKPPVVPGNTIRIGSWSHGYTSAYGSQASLDACNLVEWTPLWFAGHDYCGYAFWASLGMGSTITLTGKNAGTYTVTKLVYLTAQGGKAPWFTHSWDLVLQTCKGSGTQLVFATKTG